MQRLSAPSSMRPLVELRALRHFSGLAVRLHRRSVSENLVRVALVIIVAMLLLQTYIHYCEKDPRG
eukprot:105119-Pleurochrysis_carterae.AAC.2